MTEQEFRFDHDLAATLAEGWHRDGVGWAWGHGCRCTQRVLKVGKSPCDAVVVLGCLDSV